MPALYAVRDPETLTRVFSSVQDLTRDQATHVRFSNHTALVRTLHGDDLMATLDDGNRSTDAPSLVARTEDLLRKHTYAFGAHETLWWKEEETIGRVGRLRQTDSKGIPVYGGVFIASFEQDGRSTFVNNSCYPVGADSFADRFKLSQSDALKTAKRFVAARLVKPKTAVASLLAVPGDNFLVGEEAGKVIFPGLTGQRHVQDRGNHRRRRAR